MTERERQIEYLMEWPICIDRAEAERRTRDLDLWLVEPDLRPDLQGEEAVREWEGAVAFITAMPEGFAYTGDGVINNATSQLLYDAPRRRGSAPCQRAGRGVGRLRGPGYPSTRSRGPLRY